MTICGALCSNATVMADGSIIGDASESAIMRFIMKYDDPTAIRANYPKVAEIPFNSVNKYQVGTYYVSKNMWPWLKLCNSARGCRKRNLPKGSSKYFKTSYLQQRRCT